VRPFQYARPGTVDEAIALLGEYGSAAKLLAGGTDLLVRLRLGHVRPAVVVDIKRIAALRADVVPIGSSLRIGARAVVTDIIADARVRRHFPALIDAASVVGAVQIRNRATITGNVCNASPAADTAPALLAYGAVVNLVSRTRRRSVPLTEFLRGPGETMLETAELVESIDLPLPTEPMGAAFGRVTRRRGVDLASVVVCCLVTASGKSRFAFGAVGPRPFVVEDTTGSFADPAATPTAQQAALDRLITQANPISDIRASRDYRMAMLNVMSRRVLQTAVARLREPEG
jgi:CO/xanthine dehydrogenase FAD-binding subunit